MADPLDVSFGEDAAAFGLPEDDELTAQPALQEPVIVMEDEELLAAAPSPPPTQPFSPSQRPVPILQQPIATT